MPILTLSRLKEVLDYNSNTGIFLWKIKPNPIVNIGDIAGYLRSDGYIQIRIDKIYYKAHRLAWFYIYGSWPIDQLDHKYGIRHDNRIKYLREVNNQLNQCNQRKAKVNNPTGYLGVTLIKKNGRFKASIQVKGKLKHLGYFSTAKEAHEVYLAEKRKVHPTCSI